jgi:Flp pilus assembly protein TadG
VHRTAAVASGSKSAPGAPLRRHGRGVRTRDEAGTTAAQGVLIFPALLLIIMLVFQFALYFHARAVVEAAAQDGAAAMRRADGTTAGGREAADATLASLSPDLLNNRTVVVDRTATTATVSVSGRVVALVPGFKLFVNETAAGPVERYVPLPQRSP